VCSWRASAEFLTEPFHAVNTRGVDVTTQDTAEPEISVEASVRELRNAQAYLRAAAHRLASFEDVDTAIEVLGYVLKAAHFIRGARITLGDIE